MDIFSSNVTTTQNQEKKHQEISEVIINGIAESGYIKPEILPQMNEKIRKIVAAELGFSSLFSYEDCLTLEEKKRLNLPTRQKISREMINSLSLTGQKLDNPKKTIEEIFDIYSSSISRKYELLGIKSELSSHPDLLLGYRFIASLDEDTCIICGTQDGILLKSSKDIEKIEKHNCQNKICRCVLVPVMKGVEDLDDFTYAKWLKEQPEDKKKKILGKYYDEYKSGKSLKKILEV